MSQLRHFQKEYNMKYTDSMIQTRKLCTSNQQCRHNIKHYKICKTMTSKNMFRLVTCSHYIKLDTHHIRFISTTSFTIVITTASNNGLNII